ncbi:ABC transporter ATP-binding protein [Micrococcales bacterium 31B]|nr:ABC transporter ATP-binding protein [Micrococcales bacterium 31B]
MSRLTLRATGLTVTYPIAGGAGVRALDDVSVEILPGDIVGLVGPNGSGKSTLLRCLAGLQRPSRGEVVILDASGPPRSVFSARPRERARWFAFVQQQAHAEVPVRVLDVVALGRQPHHSLWWPLTSHDERIMLSALADVGLEGFAERPWHSLSGGQQQRVHLARALAQQPDVLLLDEPTNHLDLRYQHEILEIVAALHCTVVAALHEIYLTATYCTSAVVLREGRIVAQGTPAEALTPRGVSEVWQVAARETPNPFSGPPLVVTRSFRHDRPTA